MLYLVDWMLRANSNHKAADGGFSPTARMFRDTIAAALPRCRQTLIAIALLQQFDVQGHHPTCQDNRKDLCSV